MNQKIKDEAREKIAQYVACPVHSKDCKCLSFKWGRSTICPTCTADQILSLSGETDEVCPKCKGRKSVGMFPVDCPKCDASGTIKKKWHYGPIDENGREIK